MGQGQSRGGEGYKAISPQRAGDVAISFEHGAEIESIMPKLRSDDYYTEPKIAELAARERAEAGYCRRVKEFTVGRRQYGRVKWAGETDVRKVDLEAIVQFNRCEVLVYMDEAKKPGVGLGLNKAAEVTLMNVKLFDKQMGFQVSGGATGFRV